MKQTFVISCVLSILLTLSVQAKKAPANPVNIPALAEDTILTPTPATTIPVTSQALADNNVEAVLQNEAITAKMIKLNPRAVSFVRDFMVKNSTDLNTMREWARPYFNTIEGILVKNGLPVELKYLAVVESRLKAGAISPVGAVGPWQFMPATAKGLGLRIGNGRDERRDFVKSTDAAARYLKYLYSEFGDWLLVIAAYNGGPGYVYNAIKKSKSRNFWDLQYYLPEESRNHVKKFISTHYIFEGQGGITTLTKAEATEQIASLAGYLLNRNLTANELNSSSTTTISGKYRASVIAKYINMDITDFNRYNPAFDRVMDENEGRYNLRLPAAAMEKFVANKYPILSESVEMMMNENPAVAEINKTTEATVSK